MCVCVYIYMNHCVAHLKLTQHCKSAIPGLKKKKHVLSPPQKKVWLSPSPVLGAINKYSTHPLLFSILLV